jgi:hypothetical protein
MIEVMSLSGAAAEDINEKVHVILDAAMPLFLAEKDRNVRVNALAMLLAIVFRDVNPDQHEDFMAAFEKVTSIHLEALNEHMARKTAEMLLDFVRAAYNMRNPGNDTAH